jgi:hypothetical protein
MTRAQRATLLSALVALSVGGWLLHSRIHPLKTSPVMVVPIVAAWADTVVVTLLFLSRRSARLAYLLNGLLVIYGITIMTQFGLARTSGMGSFSGLTAMAGDCAILFADFMVGKALFDGYFAEERVGVRPWIFLAPGWWLVHFVLIPAVYVVANTFWR